MARARARAQRRPRRLPGSSWDTTMPGITGCERGRPSMVRSTGRRASSGRMHGAIGRGPGLRAAGMAWAQAKLRRRANAPASARRRHGWPPARKWRSISGVWHKRPLRKWRPLAARRSGRPASSGRPAALATERRPGDAAAGIAGAGHGPAYALPSRRHAAPPTEPGVATKEVPLARVPGAVVRRGWNEAGCGCGRSRTGWRWAQAPRLNWMKHSAHGSGWAGPSAFSDQVGSCPAARSLAHWSGVKASRRRPMAFKGLRPCARRPFLAGP
jgi:hypothetical protein